MSVNTLKNKHSISKDEFPGMKALVMGLGLHGGGAESARYLAERGAEVTVTDLRDEKILAPSVEKLKAFPIRYVLGRHEIEDFQKADLVIKNPGVKMESPYLKAARRIETDISLFLSACQPRLMAVTGTKGKSSVSSALFWALNESRSAGHLKGKAWLGGNVGISPLGFVDEVKEGDDVVLELSCWQLGDLRGRDILKPRAVVMTPILRDHLDWYGTMEAYVGDKRLIYKNQDEKDVTVAADDDWGRSFLKESRGRPLIYSSQPLSEKVSGGWLTDPKGSAYARIWEISERILEVVPPKPFVVGAHQKQNLLASALALLDLGLEPDFVRESLGRFPGVEHRLEFFHESAGVRFYNDSAATIPEAVVAAIGAFEKAPVLVTGGTDKELDFTPLARAAKNVKTFILLEGTGSKKLIKLLNDAGIKYQGPFDSLDKAIQIALEAAVSGDNVVLSPGCTSFGMFLNEVDRGKKWKEGVRSLAP